VAALDAATRDALSAFHRARYVPDHAGMAIAGDISPAEHGSWSRRSWAAGRSPARRRLWPPIRRN
jgi:Predicted Zn-dependent peptidases